MSDAKPGVPFVISYHMTPPCKAPSPGLTDREEQYTLPLAPCLNCVAAYCSSGLACLWFTLQFCRHISIIKHNSKIRSEKLVKSLILAIGTK